MEKRKIKVPAQFLYICPHCKTETGFVLTGDMPLNEAIKTCCGKCENQITTTLKEDKEHRIFLEVYEI